MSNTSPSVADALQEGSTVYALNARGANRWWASVYPGQDDEGKRTSDDECKQIAHAIRAALSAAQDAPACLSKPGDPEAQSALPLADERQLAAQAVPQGWTDAVDLARNVLENYCGRLSERGVCTLASSIMDMDAMLATAQAPATDGDALDAKRYRWLRDHGFQHAVVCLGTDFDGDNFVSYRIDFNLPEPAHMKFEDDEWGTADVDSAIDAAMKEE